MSKSNEITLIGNLGQDGEFKNTTGNRQLLKGSLATNEDYKSGDQWVKKSVWHNLILWGKNAETATKHWKKGTRMMVRGKLAYNEWTKNDVKIREAVIEVFSYEVLKSGAPTVGGNLQGQHNQGVPYFAEDRI